MENRVLGKGLSALIPDKINQPTSEVVAYIRTEKVKNSRFQPRTDYSEDKLEDLKASIKEKGILQPLLVRESENGFYEIIAGERRLKAAKSLNMKDVPAIIKSVTDQEAFVIALIENVQRENLNPVEEAGAYKKLIDDFGYKHDDVAQAVGKDRSTITNLMRILKLPDYILKNVYNGKLSMGHARTLLSLQTEEDIKIFFELIIHKNLSVRELENLIKVQVNNDIGSIKIKKIKGHEILSLEEELQRFLGTKVCVISQKKRGKIIIEYYSLDDLDRIIKIIKK